MDAAPERSPAPRTLPKAQFIEDVQEFARGAAAGNGCEGRPLRRWHAPDGCRLRQGGILAR